VIYFISCLYGLGEVSRAEELFENEFAVLQPKGKQAVLAVKFLAAKKLFYLNNIVKPGAMQRTAQTKTKQTHALMHLYNLAQMDEMEGNRESAMFRYSEIAREGNKLWIAEQSAKRLECLVS